MRRLLELQRNLVHITIAVNLYMFSASLVGVFIPLVILQSGGKLWQIPAFYLIYALIKLAVNYQVVSVIQKRGAHFGLGAAFIFGAIQLLAVLGYSMTQNAAALVLAAAALSFSNAFSWNSQHIYISNAMTEETKSSSIATISIFGQIGGIAAPLIGGLVGGYFGTSYLLALAICFNIAALWPLRKMDRFVGNADQKVSYNFSGAPARDILANFCFNIEAQVGILVWPIYLAVFVATFKGIGAITAIAAAVTMFVTWLAGKRGDRGNDRAVMREGVAISSAIDVIRIFVTTQFWIAVVTSAYKASLAYFMNAWVSTYYHHAKHKGLQYIMSMEIANDLAFVFLWGTLTAILLVSDNTRVFFNAAFVFAAAAAWGCLLITKQGMLEKG